MSFRGLSKPRDLLRNLLYLGEDDYQRIQSQRLDQRETKNQCQLNSSACAGVASQRLGGSSSCFALSKSAHTGSDRHCKSGGDSNPVRAGSSFAALGINRRGDEHNRKRQKDIAECFPHLLSPYASLPGGG